LLEEDAVLAEDAGVDVVAGADEVELSEPELDFAAPSVGEPDGESLPPSLEPEELSFDPPSAFGAAEDFDG
jgi:hypothetical protein